MSAMQPSNPPARKSPDHPRGQAVHAIRESLGSASADSAQKTIERAFEAAYRVAQVLNLNGHLRPIVTHLAKLQSLLETGPLPDIDDVLARVSRSDRAEDESREECRANGCTAEELTLLRMRTVKEIAEKYVGLRAIDAKLVELSVEASQA